MGDRKKTRGSVAGSPRTGLLRGVLAATPVVAGVALGLYAWKVEPHRVEVVERSLPIAGLPQKLKGARLVLLSDIHAGPQVSDSYLLSVFERVAGLEPDIVVVAGDFTTAHHETLGHARRVYAHLPHGRLATFGVLGNHDYGDRWDDPMAADGVAATLGDLGIRVLRNEVLDVGGVQFVGLDELWAGRFDAAAALAGIDPVRPMVTVVHNPDAVDLPGWDGFAGWVLAGHTHGGQVKPPLMEPPVLYIKNRAYAAGEIDLGDGRQMYVSRGVGHTLKVRFGVRPEITVFTLEDGDRPDHRM
jgi:hypothetical protein